MTTEVLYAIPAWLLFLLLVGGSMSLAWVATLLVRPRMQVPVDDAHNEVAGFIFSAITLVYAVTLAFLVIIVWEQYLNAENAVSQEAAALIAAARDTASFPEPARQQVHARFREYAEFVTTYEWRIMSEDTLEREERSHALATINAVWTVYRALPPTTVDPHITESLDTLSERRAVRLQVSMAALPGYLWFAMVFGGVVTVGFCLVLHLENVRLHAGMAALLAGLIATSLWLIVVINRPFAGDLRVSTDAFQHALHVIDSLPR